MSSSSSHSARAESGQTPGERREKVIGHAAHLLPVQGPSGLLPQPPLLIRLTAAFLDQLTGIRVLACTLLLSGSVLLAQTTSSITPPREDHQFWSELQVTKHVNKKQDLVVIGVVRIGRNWQRPVDERIGAGYAFKINPHLTIMPTYLHVEYQPYPGKIIHEERLIMNATLKGNLGKFLFTDRNLYERRVRPNTADFNVYRNRLQIDHPAQIGNFKFKPFIADEIWHSDQHRANGAAYGWYRNRISAGIIRQMSERLSGEFYVLMQHDGLSRPGNIPVAGALFRYTL